LEMKKQFQISGTQDIDLFLDYIEYHDSTTAAIVAGSVKYLAPNKIELQLQFDTHEDQVWFDTFYGNGICIDLTDKEYIAFMKGFVLASRKNTRWCKPIAAGSMSCRIVN
jgi:hypothetical protein